MADATTCPNCGKTLVQVALLGNASMTTFRCDCAEAQPEKPCFTPLDSKVLNAVAAAAGISLDRSVGFSLQFREPALVVAVVEYHVSTEAFAAAVDSIRAIPEGKAS